MVVFGDDSRMLGEFSNEIEQRDKYRLPWLRKKNEREERKYGKIIYRGDLRKDLMAKMREL